MKKTKKSKTTKSSKTSKPIVEHKLGINDSVLKAIRSKYVPSSNNDVEDIFKDRKRFERSTINGLNIKESNKIVYLIRYVDENDNLEYEEEREGYVDSFLIDKTNVYVGNNKYKIVPNEDVVGVYNTIDNTKKIQSQENKLIELKEQLESIKNEEENKEHIKELKRLQNKIDKIEKQIEDLVNEDGSGIVTWVDGYEQIDAEH